MTQAFNLAQLANNLNTSGQLDATDGLTGLLANSNLASSGTADSTTFLRGDRTWATVVQKLVQIQTSAYNTETSTTSSSFTDTGLSCSITPTSSSNRIIVLAQLSIYCANNANNRDETMGYLQLIRGGSSLENTQIQSGITSYSNAKRVDYTQTYVWYDTPASTSSQTYKMQMRTSGYETIIAQRSGTWSCMILLEVTA